MRQLVTTIYYERTVQCICTSVKTTKYAKKYEEYASTLSAGNDGLPLKYDELVGVLSHQLDDELHEATGMVLAKVLDTQVYQLILDLDVVDTDLDLLHQLFHEKYLSAMCLARRL